MDICVECVTPDGLFSKKRVWFRGIFHSIGILEESPFVSKLRKAESAQHSMHLTWGRFACGIFRHFPGLSIFLLPNRIHARSSAMPRRRKPTAPKIFPLAPAHHRRDFFLLAFGASRQADAAPYRA